MQPLSPAVKASLEKWYGASRAAGVQQVEQFEICEYGRRPNDKEVRELFPMLK